MARSSDKRKKKRKFKRQIIRFGPEEPKHSASAVQISSTGVFIATNKPIYAKGSSIVVELTAPGGKFVVPAVVRHARNRPPAMARNQPNGMGVEFASVSPELEEFLDTL